MTAERVKDWVDVATSARDHMTSWLEGEKEELIKLLVNEDGILEGAHVNYKGKLVLYGFSV
jgi:hypothetical protein